MNEINIDQHYSSNPKAERPKHAVAIAPEHLPSYSLCRDEDMNRRISALNKDIYESSKKEKNKSGKTFLKCFGGLVALVIGIRFIRSKF